MQLRRTQIQRGGSFFRHSGSFRFSVFIPGITVLRLKFGYQSWLSYHNKPITTGAHVAQMASKRSSQLLKLFTVDLPPSNEQPDSHGLAPPDRSAASSPPASWATTWPTSSTPTSTGLRSSSCWCRCLRSSLPSAWCCPCSSASAPLPSCPGHSSWVIMSSAGGCWNHVFNMRWCKRHLIMLG